MKFCQNLGSKGRRTKTHSPEGGQDGPNLPPGAQECVAGSRECTPLWRTPEPSFSPQGGAGWCGAWLGRQLGGRAAGNLKPGWNVSPLELVAPETGGRVGPLSPSLSRLLPTTPWLLFLPPLQAAPLPQPGQSLGWKDPREPLNSRLLVQGDRAVPGRCCPRLTAGPTWRRWLGRTLVQAGDASGGLLGKRDVDRAQGPLPTHTLVLAVDAGLREASSGSDPPPQVWVCHRLKRLPEGRAS